ncbi:hypothetical protein OCS_04408 [Ophiocordyceps sinensis CO18]|uniref:Uncharacterized protein n=1 Tax=Ophiocordyceps sinensis (strain Co18 / CGMCC 3.14243) TaxID=911162 RepID=T5ABB1_OPHSC|nr:hypothetical protein OCS_04408 [Ophiocordyceps sinensis CO18]
MPPSIGMNTNDFRFVNCRVPGCSGTSAFSDDAATTLRAGYDTQHGGALQRGGQDDDGEPPQPCDPEADAPVVHGNRPGNRLESAHRVGQDRPEEGQDRPEEGHGQGVGRRPGGARRHEPRPRAAGEEHDDPGHPPTQVEARRLVAHLQADDSGRDGDARRAGGQVRPVVPSHPPRRAQRCDRAHARGDEEDPPLAEGLHGLRQLVRGVHRLGGSQHLEGAHLGGAL